MVFDYIYELPKKFSTLALANQKIQGNREDAYLRIGTTKSKGGFNVKETIEGPLFWSDVKNGFYDSPYVLKKLREIREKKAIEKKENVLQDQKQAEISLQDLMNEINNL
jgi:hypothetical protein